MRSFHVQAACTFVALVMAFSITSFVFPNAFASEDTEIEMVDQIQDETSEEVSYVGDSICFNSSDIVSIDIKTSKSPVTAEDADGLKAIVLGLIGSYDMVTTEYTYTSSNGYTNKQVTTEPDYAWMFSAGFFAIVLYSLFRVLGVIIKHE